VGVFLLSLKSLLETGKGAPRQTISSSTAGNKAGPTKVDDFRATPRQMALHGVDRALYE
jgi:hypothetical protein